VSLTLASHFRATFLCRGLDALQAEARPPGGRAATIFSSKFDAWRDFLLISERRRARNMLGPPFSGLAPAPTGAQADVRFSHDGLKLDIAPRPKVPIGDITHY